VVKKCKHRYKEKEYAVKIMRNHDEERLLAAQNEYDLLKKITHEHVVKVKEFYPTEREIFTVMELIDGQELFDRISEIDKYDESVARHLFVQLLQTIDYLHSNRICHRDIKPSNILVLRNQEKIKLTDFNVSKYCPHHFQMLTQTGTEAFKAPEMFKYAFYNEKVDLWSAGCVLYTMLGGYQPFYDEKYFILTLLCSAAHLC
jgi:serine/threonine protein kinase